MPRESSVPWRFPCCPFRRWIAVEVGVVSRFAVTESVLGLGKNVSRRIMIEGVERGVVSVGRLLIAASLRSPESGRRNGGEGGRGGGALAGRGRGGDIDGGAQFAEEVCVRFFTCFAEAFLGLPAPAGARRSSSTGVGERLSPPGLVCSHTGKHERGPRYTIMSSI